MANNSFQNNIISEAKFFNRRLKTLLLIALLILVWIIIIHFFSSYIKSSSETNWIEIDTEKIAQQNEVAKNLFGAYQSELNKFSESICSNTDIVKQIQKSDSKKLFESLLSLNFDNSYNVEIYNTRLELLAFKGRRLDSDIYSLQKSLNGKKYSLLKEIGFYTYLIIYSPVYDLKEKSQVVGVLLTAKLIDIKNQINNKFFRNTGLLSDISGILKVNPEIISANSISGKIDLDSSVLDENNSVELHGTDDNVIGIILIPKYSQVSHVQSIESTAKRISSLLVFGLTVIFFLIGLKFISQTDNWLLKFFMFTLLLTVIRFVWLEYNFPSKTFESDIFSPGYYASTIGFGTAKSIGELLITSVFVLAVSLYFIKLISKKQNSRKPRNIRKYLVYASDLLLAATFFALIYLFGSVIQSIVFDSNLKFFDRTSIIPNSELIIVQLIILLLSFSLFTLLTSLIILIYKNSFYEIAKNKYLRKYFVFILLAVFLICSHFAVMYFNNFRIEYIYRVLIIVFTVFFGAYLSGKIILSKSYNVFSIKNFSIIILFCIIVIPGILLEKITSQETYFVELIGRKISEKDDDRIKFLLMTELSNITDDKKLENNIKNKNKLPELAFSIWTDSKFSEENFNTAVIVLDTNKKILSDFNFNLQALNPDSILKYAETNFFRKKDKYKEAPDTASVLDSLEYDEPEETVDETEDTDSAAVFDNLFVTDEIVTLKNEKDKYYLGIVPIEKVDLKNTVFRTNLGYLLVAVNYDSKNFLTQSSMQLFKNYSKDNLFDKLISTPIITEYIGGEIVSSTNQDLSKANTFSLEAFREAIKYKNEKYDWRYEIINNEKYRTFYIQGYPQENSGFERIYSISLKRNDFKLTTFFYLKFILFVVSVYLLVLAIISVFMLLEFRKFRLNFREKLFASFFFVSVIPIVLLAIYTRSFIKDKYDSNFQNQIISDLNLVSQSIKSNQIILNNLDSLSKEQNKQLAKSLYQTEKNFNLYLKAKLVLTTNEELYKSDLLDTRIDADAYYNIVYLRKDFFSKTEEIGVYSFIVGYKPFFDSKNNIVGLMSSQSVYRQNEINEELTEILTFIFGIYFIVIIILLVFVTFLTDRISKPILRLQNATERISQGESNVELEIKRKDEIGNLVNSFNKMTKELESSKNKLKKAEREAAWRDIARRVAHEIKNPLTPMKLSIQHLYDVYNNGGKNNFEEVLTKTKNIIINEVNKLNRIATEFSTFAKLSGRKYQPTDLNEVIEEVISLYKLEPKVEFREHLDKSIGKILADKEELNRVFQNLIKNSIQAIERNGLIEIKTYEKEERIFAEVHDNGSGIDEAVMKNLFEPNFSTKTTGMGLGLAITKKSIDDMRAEIRFESTKGTGTKVIIEFNKYQQ